MRAALRQPGTARLPGAPSVDHIEALPDVAQRKLQALVRACARRQNLERYQKNRRVDQQSTGPRDYGTHW